MRGYLVPDERKAADFYKCFAFGAKSFSSLYVDKLPYFHLTYLQNIPSMSIAALDRRHKLDEFFFRSLTDKMLHLTRSAIFLKQHGVTARLPREFPDLSAF
jgi:hypothetical protein